MKLIRIGGAESECSFPERRERVISLGFFDGLHLGHRLLLRRAFDEANARGFESAAFTFSEEGIKPGGPRLMSFEEKLAALGSSGVFTVFAADFKSVRDLSPEDFVRDLLIGKCGAKVAVCGFNFRFGRDAAGDSGELCRLMRKYGGEAIVIDPVSVGDRTVSSTAIRSALAEGNVELAAELLGRPHSLDAPVSHGARIGRTIEFPTINQYFHPTAIIPKYGVYAVKCVIGGEEMEGVCNIGVRPTVGGEDKPRCETHVFGLDREIYGEQVRVKFLRFLRAETRFDSLDELRAQIALDVAAAKEYFENK